MSIVDNLEYTVGTATNELSTNIISVASLCSPYKIQYISPNIIFLTGYNAERFSGNENFWLESIHPDDRFIFKSELESIINYGNDSINYRFRHRNGNYINLSSSFKVTKSIDNNNSLIICSTTSKEENTEFINIRHFSQMLAKHTSDPIYITDTMGYIKWANQSFRKLFQSSDNENLSNAHISSFDISDDSATVQQWRHLLTGNEWSGTSEKVTRNGKVIAVQESITPYAGINGIPTEFVGIITVRNSSRTEPDQEYVRTSMVDPLTGLLSASNFQTAANKMFSRAVAAHANIFCAVTKLCNYGDIETLLDDKDADELLRVVSLRMRNHLNHDHLIGHFGDGVFVTLGPSLATNVEQIDTIFSLLSVPVKINGHAIALTVKTGFARDKAYKSSFSNLYLQAKKALEHIEFKPDGLFLEYTKSNLDARRSSASIRQSLKYAAQKNQLYLLFQPIICAKTRSTLSVEALVRWTHPKYGTLSPDRFIPIAEETGDIIAIGNEVLDMACRHLSMWRKTGLYKGRMAINVSAIQLRDESFSKNLINVIEKYDLSPEDIEIELTETALIEENDDTVKALISLHDKGYRFILDDFGKGHSNFNYLTIIPIAKIKVDRQFIQKSFCRKKSWVVLKNLVNLARDLGCRILGEGVETEDTFHFLQDLNFDEMQGFHFGRPMAPEKFVEYLGHSEQSNPDDLLSVQAF